MSDPIYIRGIELWIPAIFLYGLFFLRFGLLTTMVGHCTYNALIGTGLLLRANDSYLVASGLLILALLIMPLLPGLFQQWTTPETFGSGADPRLQVLSASTDDYRLLRRLRLANWLAGNELEEIFGMDSQRFSSVKMAVPEGKMSADYEVVCLKSETAIEGVAIAQLSPLQSLPPQSVPLQSATLQTVYVSPRYRRCYYGTQMIQALVQRLHQRGVVNIETEAAMGNRRSTLFWSNQKWTVLSQKFQSRQRVA